MPDTSALRSMPASKTAEEHILAAMLTDVAAVDLAVSLLKPGDFYHRQLQHIFEVIADMSAARMHIDLVTVTERILALGQLEQIGGPHVLGGLVNDSFASAAAVESYAKILREKATLRDIIHTCAKWSAAAYDTGETSVEDILDQWQTEVMGVSAARSSVDTARHITDGVLTALDTIEHAYEHRGRTVGLTTGFVDLDRMTGGLRPGQIVIIAGRPGMGKSVMGVALAEHAAAAGTSSLIFSLEMSYEELCTRMTCSAARIDLGRVRDGFLKQEEDFRKLSDAATSLCRMPIYIDDTPALTINDFRARARRAAQKLGVKLIVVDYIGLMRSTSRRAEMSKVIEMGEISAALKQTAKELGLPIVVLAQLNRNVEERRGNRPVASDLRDSGNLEQDADLIGLLYREAYYFQKEEQREARAESLGISRTEFENACELIIVKQRNGPVGSIPLVFIGEQTRFESSTKRLYSNNPDEHQHNR